MLQLNKNKEGVGSMNIKKWSVSPLDKARAAKIAEEMQYPSFLAMLLEIRGFHTKDDIDALFDVSQSFADPFLMKDMDCASKTLNLFVYTEIMMQTALLPLPCYILIWNPAAPM